MAQCVEHVEQGVDLGWECGLTLTHKLSQLDHNLLRRLFLVLLLESQLDHWKQVKDKARHRKVVFLRLLGQLTDEGLVLKQGLKEGDVFAGLYDGRHLAIKRLESFSVLGGKPVGFLSVVLRRWVLECGRESLAIELEVIGRGHAAL